jgi:aminopeptidase N
MTLHALRVKIGDDALFRTLKACVKTFSGGVASTQDFISIAEGESGCAWAGSSTSGSTRRASPPNW